MSAPNFNSPLSPFPKRISDLRPHFSLFALFRLLIFQLATSQQLFVTQCQTYTTKLRFWKQLYLNYKSKKHQTPERFATNKINQIWEISNEINLHCTTVCQFTFSVAFPAPNSDYTALPSEDEGLPFPDLIVHIFALWSV